MRLKKLEMQGFKSFADKTEIFFDDGITAVVGPNGSGKSNISDAIRWVLGEQSVKTLRGSKMGDVIFSGTQNRNSVGFCQVSLVFDNDDSWLKVDFSEVTITRRYYKSGESEYSINKKICRLKDILELFRDTGVGKEGYSIIGQGQITNILSSNSADRRMAFEAATGVLTYKTRKAEAEQRLNKTTENMVRLQDILLEMSNNLETLEGQAAQAKDFISCRDRLEELEISQFYYKQLKIQDKLENSGTELEQIKATMSEFDHAEQQLIDQRQQLEQEIDEIQQRKIQVQIEYNAIHEDVLRHDNERQLFEQKQQSNEQELNRISQFNAEKLLEVKQTKEKRKNIAESIRINKEKLTSAQSDFIKVETELNQIKKECLELEELLDNKKQAKIDYLNKSSESKINLSRFTTMLDTINDRLAVIKENKKDISDKITSMKVEKEAYDKKVFEYEAIFSDQFRKLEEYKQNIQKGKEKRYWIQQSIRELEIEANGVKSKINVLTNLQTGYEDYFEAVKQLMKNPNTNKKVLGTVAEIIDVPSKFIVAIETALGNNLQNIVTENEQDAKELINFLKQNRMGRATFYPLSTIKGSYLNSEEQRSVDAMQGIFGAGCDIVSFDARFENIVKKLLGRVVIAENLDVAIQLMKSNGQRFTVVTLDGDIMFAGGAMTGGSKKNKKSGILSRNDEVNQLKEREIEISKKLIEHQNELGDCQDKLADADQKTLAFETKQSEHKDEYEHQKNNQQMINIQIENENNKISALEEEAEQLIDNKEDIEAQINFEDKSDDQIQDVDEKELVELQQQVAILNQKQEELQQRQTNLLLEKTSAEKDIFAMENDGGRYERRIAKFEQEIVANEQQANTLREQMEQLKERFLNRTTENTEQQEQEDSLRVKLDGMEKRQEACRIQQRDGENHLENLREQNKVTLDRRYSLQMEIEKMKMETSSFAQDIFEKYDITFDQIDKNTLLPEIEVKGREINSIRNKIRAMGNVNIHAIDDYAELKGRQTEIVTQLDDLLTSKADLEDLINRLFVTMNKQFNEQFQLINDSFSKIFVELFGGGSASLKLGEGNAMECDIDIVAQPPGKKLQTISLLSGGEKALAAIAILFAMLELKPTPFCVLDEIEAALDEANVYGFANYLANYSNDTQFIVITHRRGVMDNCNTVYGVAMQEKGISKVISLKVEENGEHQQEAK